MSPRRCSRHQAALRARRQAIAVCARSRHDRLAQGPEAAASWELALMGALVRRPRLVRAFAAGHPPDWFVDASALVVMRGLFCSAAGIRKATVDDLIETLERHEALALAGGPDAVRALVAPRPELDCALLELGKLMDALEPAEREQVRRAEDLDDLDELRSKMEVPVASMEPSTVRLVEQLELFARHGSVRREP